MGDGLRDVLDPRLQADPPVTLLDGQGPVALDRHDADPQRHRPQRRCGRGPRRHRRVRLGQVDDRALDHAASAARRRRRRARSRSTAPSSSAGPRREMVRHPRQGRRHGVPGADDRAQPGEDHRRPGGGDGPRPHRAGRATRRCGSRARRSTASSCPRAASRSTAIRTSSAAASASASSSRWRSRSGQSC